MNAAALIASRRALVFDLDGTLADTVTDLWLALNAALRDCGLADVEAGLVRASLHGGLDGTAQAALLLLRADSAALPQLCRLYAEHYRARAHESSSLYAGVRELLDVCRVREVALAVCTNKSRSEALALLSKLGIADHFACVIGGDTAARPKPHPAPLIEALHALGCEAHQALLIGDSHVDAQCACSAGVEFVLHAGGYGGPHELGYPVAARFLRYGELG